MPSQQGITLGIYVIPWRDTGGWLVVVDGGGGFGIGLGLLFLVNASELDNKGVELRNVHLSSLYDFSFFITDGSDWNYFHFFFLSHDFPICA